jgi:hypothetical protein
MGLFIFLIGMVAGCFVWDYAGEEIKKLIMNLRNR